MAEQILKNKNVTFSIRYRAICTEGDYRGIWRSEKIQALQDALKHQGANNMHKVDIHVEQKQSMILSIDNE